MPEILTWFVLLFVGFPFLVILLFMLGVVSVGGFIMIRDSIRRKNR